MNSVGSELFSFMATPSWRLCTHEKQEVMVANLLLQKAPTWAVWIETGVVANIQNLRRIPLNYSCAWKCSYEVHKVWKVSKCIPHWFRSDPLLL